MYRKRVKACMKISRRDDKYLEGRDIVKRDLRILNRYQNRVGHGLRRERKCKNDNMSRYI